MAVKNQNQGMSEDTKTIITVLLLIFVFPVGVIMMWVWMKWPTWVKILITLPMIGLLLLIIGAFAAGFLSTFNPSGAIKAANDTARLADLVTLQKEINTALTNSSINALCNGKPGPCMGDSTDNDPNVKNTDGTGWVKIKLGSLTQLPIDPVNNDEHSYTYCSDGTNWEIQVGFMESAQALQKAKSDGGDDDEQREIGTDLTVCEKVGNILRK